MKNLKVATFNVEWMVSIFGGVWKNWDGAIPDTFAGKFLGKIKLESIEDVPGLCRRIAGVIRDTEAKIIGIQEGPPRTDQMELFVKQFLNNDYKVYRSNRTWQTIYALVHKTIADRVTVIPYDSVEMKTVWTKIPFQPWATISNDERKIHRFHRRPLVLTFEPSNGKRLTIIIVHTKSKVSKLKEAEQWENRDPEAVLSALESRQKLSAEVYRLRQYINGLIAPPNSDEAVIVMGDLNDGPLAEDMEREFLIHNIVDELIGSVMTPKRILQHAMSPIVLESAKTTKFRNPFKNNEITEELIDHMLVSPGIWRGASPFALKADSCRVEDQVYEQYNDDVSPEGKRGLRPSDHKPISAILEC